MTRKFYSLYLLVWCWIGVFLYAQEEEIAVFGQHLFQGDFRDESFTGFNPNYQVAVGDKIRVQVWGAVELALDLTVDPQGNVFIPNVGPVSVLGVRNETLNEVIRNTIKEVYFDNVEIYATLEDAQPVKVFVTGYVVNPGLYGGFSSDSILFYLDKAGGIDPKRGSFIDISVKRGQKIVNSVNLYEFLAEGRLEYIQLADGDVIFVNPIKYQVTISGDVNNAFLFEFAESHISLEQALELAQVQANATHLSISRKTAGKTISSYHSLDSVDELSLRPGDEVGITTDLKPETILVKVTGEQLGPKQLILPYGARLNDAVERLVPDERSDFESIQLFRREVAIRQKEMLDESLTNLEKNILGARSSSREEAQLRVAEADLLTKFIAKAKEVEPKGQIVLGEQEERNVYLENGDVLFVPAHTSLVMIHGEVAFPNTQVYSFSDTVADYVERAGGFTQNADKSNILILKRNGSIINLKKAHGNYKRIGLTPGDEVIVMPKVNFKSIQLVKDITQILFQIAVATRTIVAF